MRTLACLMLLVPALAGAATPVASSVGKSTEGTHPATHAFDGSLVTAWAEGELGDGEGAWIEVRFDRPVDIGSVSIWPGWMGGVDRDIRLHGRPRNVTLTFDVVGGEPVTEQDVVLDPGEEQKPLRHDIRVEVNKVRKVRLTMDTVYGGGIYSDTYITEIAFNLVAGEPVAQVGQVQSWLETSSGKRADDAHQRAVVGLYDKIAAEQFGDRDSLRKLMDWAADGAPHIRRRAQSIVPYGFRLNAIRPDQHALKALLKIKDANAVAALDRAALRTTGRFSEDLSQRARMLYAYAQIEGGGRRNIDPWGETGFEKGALQSFGEPLPVAVDEYGGLYVADVGNHRVQRFSLDNGAYEESWGANEPGLAEVWFLGKRAAYASGSVPAVEGGFVLPVDVEIVPGRKGDTIYVLDVGRMGDSRGPYGRVTEIKPDGTIGHQELLPFSNEIAARAGGEAHMVVSKRQLTVLWANEGITYSLPKWQAGEVFTLEDGSARGAIALSGGNLGLIYGLELVKYGGDGYRYGTVMGPAVLGDGYEDWDIAYDDRRKLWVVLDTGEVIRLKGVGKEDYRFRISETELDTPRIDVYDDVVFVSAEDHVLTGDARQLFAEQSSGESAGGTLEIGGDE